VSEFSERHHEQGWRYLIVAMETDAEASGIQTWLFGSVSAAATTNQTHRKS
jgi:hypothetical protein